ncbi:MAG: hypothetical protein ABI479_04065 [Gallionella sp.]
MNVFMFHFGRSGSTVLANAIASIPDFFWHGEIFTGGTVVYDGFEALELSSKKGGGRFDCSEFLEFIDVAKQGIERQIGHPIMRYGCEIKSFHFEFGYFSFPLENALEALASSFPDSRFIFLRRRNSLRRILSATIARQTGIYHIKTVVDKPNRIQIDLDAFEDADLNFRGEITAVLRNSMAVENRYAEAILKHGGFEICYEDHIEASLEPAMTILSQQLDVECVVPETQLRKTNPFPLSETIENYEELWQRLSVAGMDNFLL